MRISDEVCLAKGFVSPSFVDVATGERMPFCVRSNKLSYMSAEAMAAAFGGDPSFIPNRIGFIYGSEPMMPTESVITRTQSWDLLLKELSSSEPNATVDVQIVNFSYAPSLGAEKSQSKPFAGGDSSFMSSSDSPSGDSHDTDQSDYGNIIPSGSNAITFHAVSNSQDRGAAFRSSVFVSGNYIYQALLICHNEERKKNYIISRVSLKEMGTSGSSYGSSSSSDGTYLQKPAGFEVALDWTVVFH